MPLIEVSTYQRWMENVADRIDPLVSASKPYLDGLDNLPSDGRFLLVGNHTQAGTEALLIPYVVRRQIGIRVRPLADRRFGNVGVSRRISSPPRGRWSGRRTRRANS